MELIDNFLSER